jgi:hypothetical protein
MVVSNGCVGTGDLECLNGADADPVFLEGHIQHPMHLVFGVIVPTHRISTRTPLSATLVRV